MISKPRARALALTVFLAFLPGAGLAQYLPEPGPVPDGISASEAQSLEAHYWAIEDLAAALEPLIEQHESRCASVDTRDSALMAECAESEAFLSDNIDYYFTTLDDYQSRRSAALQAAERAEAAARVESAAALDHEAAFRARLDPETIRRLTSHRLFAAFNLLLDARLAARGDASAQAVNEEVDRLYDEITPPWAKPIPPGGYTPQEGAQLSRHQLLEAYNLLLEQRIAERGDSSPQAIDEEAERLLSEISPLWYNERRGGFEAMKALELPDDTDLSSLPSGATIYQQALDLQDDEDFALLFGDELSARPDAGEGGQAPEDICGGDPIGCVLIRWPPFSEPLENDPCGGDPLGCIVIRVPSWGQAPDDGSGETSAPNESLHVLLYPDLEDDPLAIDPQEFLASCGGGYMECVRRWPEPETKTDYVLSSLHYANVLAADVGLSDEEKWEFSLAYLAAQARKDPANQAARDALNYVQGLHAGATGGR